MLPAIQSVVDRGIVDEKAIGIQGHSWGGYQIAYMVTQTNRFKAVAAGAPVADMISAYDGIRWGTGLPRQFQYERTQSRIGGSHLAISDALHREFADLLGRPRAHAGDDSAERRRRRGAVVSGHRVLPGAAAAGQGSLSLQLQRPAARIAATAPDQKDYTIRLQQYFDHYLKGAPAPDWMEKGVPFLEKDHTALSGLGRAGSSSYQAASRSVRVKSPPV